MSYKIQMTNNAFKDYQKIKVSKFAKKAKELLQILEINPFQIPPPFERLKGDLSGLCSRRINKQHRLVYEVKNDCVIIKSMWTHYENI